MSVSGAMSFLAAVATAIAKPISIASLYGSEVMSSVHLFISRLFLGWFDGSLSVGTH